MLNLEEKRYYIDSGEGSKRSNCPSYSCYKDGRDVKNEIIPPRGYDLKGFIFDPLCSDKSYDGIILAEYEKTPFITRFKQYYWKYLFMFLGLIIVFIALFEFRVFNNDKINPKTHQYISNRIDTSAKNDSVSSVSSNSTQPDSISAISDALSSKAFISTKKDAGELKLTETTILIKEEPVEKEIVEKVKPEEKPIKKEDHPIESVETVQFKKEFWTLIHRKARQMDTYDVLYFKHKGKVKGKEYDYLRATILKNSNSFKDWVRKLDKIPNDEIEAIDNINTLEEKLNI